MLAPLTVDERALVKAEIPFWHHKKWLVHAATVMPEHVHVLATPLEARRWEWYSLPEILHSVKRRSARCINTGRGRRGSFWQEERYDRISRGQEEFEEKLDYILHNAARRGWCESMEGIVRPGERPSFQVKGERHVGERVPRDTLVQRRRDLPHWDLGGSTYFISFNEVGYWPKGGEQRRSP